MECFAAPPTTLTMETSLDLFSSRRPRRSERHDHHAATPSQPPSYGYHNTFHTHHVAVLASPPTYAHATSAATQISMQRRAAAEAQQVRTAVQPPPYSCTAAMEGLLGMKQELSSIFEVARVREWNDVYAIVRGTQLCIHRPKGPSLLCRNREPAAGRLLRSYSLQHAEVGVAADFRKTRLCPKSPLTHLVPVNARAKLYETDPHLFEPVREHAIRLRVETEQFLLCASTQEEMLTWVEMLCAAIDISPPLEDRSEPRYRSLPRRSRRQRLLDGPRLGEVVESLSSLDVGQRIIAEQEEIIRQLYPQLGRTTGGDAPDTAPATRLVDPDRDEFDPDDVRFPTRPGSADRPSSQEGDSGSDGLPSSRDGTARKHADMPGPSSAQIMRYRRRCAPVLLACSPRVSDVVFSQGQRLRVIARDQTLTEYESHPPRYDAHGFPKAKRSPKTIKVEVNVDPATAINTTTIVSIDPLSSPLISDESLASFGYDLSTASSAIAGDEIQPVPVSEPPSPTGLSHKKAEVTRQLQSMPQHKSAVESRDANLERIERGLRLLF